MVKESIQQILEDIQKVKDNNGITHNVELMAVSKTKPVEAVVEALDAGQILFGENRVLEAYDKFNSEVLKDRKFSLHIIGHLQRNKAKKAVEIADMVQSVDKLSTMDVMEKHLINLGKTLDYLIEVNTSFEPQKEGVTPEALEQLLADIADKQYSYLNLRGFMTIGPLTNDEVEIGKSFSMLKTLFEKTKSSLGKDDFDVLSMGMSSDYSIAIKEGSTLIRVGSRIFGNRLYK